MILRLTDGSVVCDLIWHSSANRRYMLVRDGWAPAVPPLRLSELGGIGPYENTIEEIEVNVIGASPAEALANLGALSRLLDQAERWWRYDASVSLVQIQYTPEGGTNLLQAVILGRAAGDETQGISLPVSFNRDLNAYMIAGLRLRFLRRGQWLATTTASAASASATYPTVHTATFGSSASVLSPIDVSISGFTAASLFNLQVGYLLIAPSARLTLVEGEAMTPSSSGTGTATASTVADAAKLASGGNVERWTGTTTFTGTVRLTSGTIGGLGAGGALVAVFAAVRFNSSTITGFWQAEGWSNGALLSQGPLTPIEYASNQPQIVNLGMIKGRGGLDALALSFIGTIPIGTTLDIDYVAAIRLDDQASRVLGLVDNVSGRLSVLPGATAVALEERSNALTDRTPAVVYYDAANAITEYAGYAGDPYLLTIGTDVGVILLSTGSGPSGVGNAWRPATSGAGAAISSIVTVTRRLAYLTPE